MKCYQKIALLSVLILSFLSIYIFFQKYDSVRQLPVKNFVSDETLSDDEAKKNLQIAENYGKLPLHFEPNRGQTDESVKFFARGKGYGIFLQDKSATLVLSELPKTKNQKPKTAA